VSAPYLECVGQSQSGHTAANNDDAEAAACSFAHGVTVTCVKQSAVQSSSRLRRVVASNSGLCASYVRYGTMLGREEEVEMLEARRTIEVASSERDLRASGLKGSKAGQVCETLCGHRKPTPGRHMLIAPRQHGNPSRHSTMCALPTCQGRTVHV
jgi:hypothetical protein